MLILSKFETYSKTKQLNNNFYNLLTISHLEALPWSVLLSGIRQSKIKYM